MRGVARLFFVVCAVLAAFAGHAGCAGGAGDGDAVFHGRGAPSVARPAPPPFCWPTPWPARWSTPWEEFIQPAASGMPATGLFGTARNSGGRFHEGIDIRPFARDRRREPTDKVFAVLAGRVVHVAREPNGDYGRYVVLFHQQDGLLFYTLYAHLRSVSPAAVAGREVAAGAELGVMGRSDGRRGFPRERAHLHFEVGLRLNPAFPLWYSRNREFKTLNRQGAWNGLNLCGFDPLPFLREGLRTGRPPSVLACVRREPVAVTVDYRSARVPAFVRDNPALLTAPLPAGGGVAGWRIGFAWHGLPVRWTPLEAWPACSDAGAGGVALVEVTSDPALRRDAIVRKLVRSAGRRGSFAAGGNLEHSLAILFTE